MSDRQPESELDLGPGVRAAPGAIRLQFARGGGPGGQNVNKLSTKALLWLDVSALHGLSDAAKERLLKLAGSSVTMSNEIHITATTHRTQERNRREVLDKLRNMILRAMIEPKRRRPTRPTAGSRRRRIEGKRRRSDLKSQRRDQSAE